MTECIMKETRKTELNNLEIELNYSQRWCDGKYIVGICPSRAMMISTLGNCCRLH